MHWRPSYAALTLAALAVLAWTTPAAAQGWTGPRTSDGQPDIQGLWEAGPGANNAGHSLEEGCCEAEHNRMQNRAADNIGLRQQIVIEPSNARIPFQPWAAARRREHLINVDAPTELQHIEPEDRCALQGVPRSNLRGPLQILQTPGQVVILHEWVHAYRVIPVDGRPHAPKGAAQWQGDARGRWEGNTLVVDVRHSNGQTWIDNAGNFYSDALHVVERYTMIDADSIHYEARIEDPHVYTRPWTMVSALLRNTQPGFQFFEQACHEGNRSIEGSESIGMKIYRGVTPPGK